MGQGSEGHTQAAQLLLWRSSSPCSCLPQGQDQELSSLDFPGRGGRGLSSDQKYTPVLLFEVASSSPGLAFPLLSSSASLCPGLLSPALLKGFPLPSLCQGL